MEETPEQVLARLQRYVDSLKAREPLAPVGSASPAPVPANATGGAAAGVITDQRRAVRWSFSTLSRTIAGQIICVATCVVTIVLWINVRHVISYIVAFVAAGLLGIGVMRRVPFTGWALIGLALGLLLGRFS
jgi:hypothetical protein